MEGVKGKGYDEWKSKGQTAQEIMANAIQPPQLINISINGKDYKGTLEQVLEHVRKLYS